MDNKMLEEVAEVLGSVSENYETKMTIDEDKILILSDLHLPNSSVELLAMVRSEIKNQKPGCLVLLGDALDFHEFSSYDVTEFESTFASKMEAADTIIDYLCKDMAGHGGYVMYSMGNHDYRAIRKLGNRVSLKHIVRLIGDRCAEHAGNGLLITSDNPSLLALPDTSGKYQWFLTHPSQYSSAPFSVARSLADRYGCNVATAHSHHIGWCMHNGRMVLETGGGFDSAKMQYVQHHTSKLPSMASGFWIVEQGKLPVPYTVLK